jgi:transcriptional regulator with XRE-family HTH domain
MFLIMSAPTKADADLAATIRRLRLERAETQEDLAHRAGLTVAAFARIERGHANPTWTTVRRIAIALEITLATLGEHVEQSRAQQP